MISGNRPGIRRGARKHGNALRMLRQTYGAHFAEGGRDDEKRSDLLHKMDEPSLSKLVRPRRRKVGRDFPAGCLSAGGTGGAWPPHDARGSRSRREHEHFAIADLIFRKDIRTGFRLDLKFRVGKARSDRSDGLDLVGNGDKE